MSDEVDKNYKDPEAPCFSDLRGKVVIVTGAGTNVGRAIALRFAKEGGRIVICGRRLDPLEETRNLILQEGEECVVTQTDLTQEKDIERLFKTTLDAFGTLDVLVQNAADMFMACSEPPQAFTSDVWDHAFATNVRAAFLLARGAFSIMQEKRKGALVFISSVSGLRAHYGGLPYDATKAALDGLVRNLAVDYSAYGIRVNAVAPGRTSPLDDSGGMPLLYKEIPLGRNGAGAEVASAVAFLASNQASYITGQILYVDGGLTTQLTPRDIWI